MSSCPWRKIKTQLKSAEIAFIYYLRCPKLDGSPREESKLIKTNFTFNFVFKIVLSIVKESKEM